MLPHANPVDPPDLGLLPTLRRLLRLWWGQRRMGAVGLGFALAYTLISTAIPILMQQAIDKAVVKHTQPLWPYLLVILALGSVRFVVNFLRRYATARIGIRIEARMRELLYEAYLRYPRAFYDRHATGQVLSRATNDLYPIRYFIGWGLVQGMQSLMMIVGGKQVIGGHLSIGQFVLFETLLLQLVWPLEALGWITNLGQRALASAGRSFAWLEGIAPLPEPSVPQHLPEGPLPVRFEAVHFAYGGETDVLRDLDLVVEPGEIVAVCGSTGSGKTSLLNLLPRFYDPTGGRVLIGGVDTRDLAIAELRNDVALVTQRPILFSVPLRENLTAGREDADWEEVLAACEAAGVDSFGPSLPEGYDTLIGERGVNLSGGQRQRVALARALVTGARVVVLDDPLSAVDTLTERRLVKRLRPALTGHTVLVATQRLSTVEIADRAVVLVDGQIVESGTPADLLRAGGHFASLFGDEVIAA